LANFSKILESKAPWLEAGMQDAEDKMKSLVEDKKAGEIDSKYGNGI
jgi:hypothetical protein